MEKIINQWRPFAALQDLMLVCAGLKELAYFGHFMANNKLMEVGCKVISVPK